MKNKHFRTEVAGGGTAPVWKFRKWWTGAKITIYTPNHRFWFYFPEGLFVDKFGRLVENVLNFLYKGN